ncbi:MAG: hypothetical protein A2X86_16630 [Bdellovibrionales bacterium GWA2_49_15]|nr:MAG: hypothetical protein A2X86_16630 [Bdellovibrionales bacterium GWA2_49_15]HAZ13732.1 hypothetical protein [Bdellovibrionales bacterium]
MKRHIFATLMLLFICGQSHAATIASASMENMALFMYQLINGTSDANYAGGNGGPTDDAGRPSGFVGIIRMITGADALGGGLASCGYTACSSIPSTGSCSMTDSEGTFLMSFSAPTKVIPTGHTGADGTTKYDKRVAVSINGTSFMAIEFNCSTTVGWLRFASPEDSSGGATTNARHIEMYYDTNAAASTKLELAMYYNQANGDDEYFQAKFQTDSTSTFDLWITRSGEESGSKNAFRLGMRGNSSTKQASVFMLFQDNNNWNNASTGHADANEILVSAGTGDVMCIDYSGTPSAVDGICAGQAIAAPGALLINAAGDMSINSSVVNMSGAMTAL